jgi:hypothetical protein
MSTLASLATFLIYFVYQNTLLQYAELSESREDDAALEFGQGCVA